MQDDPPRASLTCAQLEDSSFPGFLKAQVRMPGPNPELLVLHIPYSLVDSMLELESQQIQLGFLDRGESP